MSNEEINISGFDAITETFEKIYPEQKEPLHYRPIICYELGGEYPLDGISVYRGNGYYHFVTYSVSFMKKNLKIKNTADLGLSLLLN